MERSELRQLKSDRLVALEKDVERIDDTLDELKDTGKQQLAALGQISVTLGELKTEKKLAIWFIGAVLALNGIGGVKQVKDLIVTDEKTASTQDK